MNYDYDHIILSAIAEDIPNNDLETDLIFADSHCEGAFIAMEPGVISGINVMKRVFEFIDDTVYIKVLNGNGSFVEEKDFIALIKGKTTSILKGERVALNFLQRLSGVATNTSIYVGEVKNNHTKILDTRETTPNMRILEKMAVIDGGGINHRFTLNDYVLLQDIHIKTAGSITNAVQMLKSTIDHRKRIEIEVHTFSDFLEALDTECDIIILQDMSDELIAKCVKRNTSKLLIANGNVTLKRIHSVSETGIDFISVGALTHSYKALDIRLKLNK